MTGNDTRSRDDSGLGIDAAFDALLLLSFGGPEAPAEVMPFLRRVTAGRGVPDERLAEVAEHYDHFGGRSPINAQNALLQAALERAFADRGLTLPVYRANRNSAPFCAEAFTRIAQDGHRRVAVFVTSAYPSYSGCRQYREDLAAGLTEAGLDGRLELTRLPHYFDRPGFVAPFADGLRRALSDLPEGSRVVCVTHSIPVAMDDVSGTGPAVGGRYLDGHGYTRDHRITAGLVADAAGIDPDGVDLVYCSRSGPPTVPWLDPDVNDHLGELGGRGIPGVAVVPIGFVSDHLEVRYDLDTEAAETAAGLGLPFARVPTPGDDPRLVATVVDLLTDAAAAPGATRCPAGCCANLRGPRPAACGDD